MTSIVRRRTASAAVALVLGLAAGTFAGEGFESAKRLDAEDPAARSAAVEALKKLPDRDAVIVAALRDETERSQLGPRALEALADLAAEFDLRFANGGLRAIVGSGEAPLSARKAAARALGKIGGVADVSALGDAVAVCPEEATRALVAIGGPSAMNALRRGGGDAPPLEVQAGLALLGDPSGLPRLVECLGGADSARAVALLKWATGRDLPADRAAWEGHLRRRELAEKFADLDNDKSGDFVDETAAKLRAGGNAPLAEDLVGIARDTAWPSFARDKAALTLGLGGVRSAKDALLWACRDGEVGSVRMYAAGALARVGDLSCAPTLVAMLNHDEDKDRLAGRRLGVESEFYAVDPTFIRALFRMGCRGAADRAIDLLAGEYRTRLHRDCLRALAEIGGAGFKFQPDGSKPERAAAMGEIRAWWREARETIAIEPKADDPGWPEFRKAIDENIATLGGFKFLYQMRAKNLLVDLAEPARPQIEAALANESELIRIGAADVLAAAALRVSAKALAERLKSEKAAPVLTRLLVALEVCARPWPDGRPSAGPEIAEAVRGALADKSIDVRIAAVRTLGVVGDLAVDQPRLVKLRADPKNDDESFRFTVAAAVVRLAYRFGLADVCAQLRSDDVALRSEAAKSLAAAGIDLKGYDPDLAPEAREAAIRRMIVPGVTAISTVPYKERK